MNPSQASVPLLAVALAISACGADDTEGDDRQGTRPPDASRPTQRDAPSPSRVRVELDEFSFSPSMLAVRRGAVIEARNVGSTAHNLTIERGSDPAAPSARLGATATFGPGATDRVRADLPPGRYSLVCTVPGHREAGMVGRLAVR